MHLSFTWNRDMSGYSHGNFKSSRLDSTTERVQRARKYTLFSLIGGTRRETKMSIQRVLESRRGTSQGTRNTGSHVYEGTTEKICQAGPAEPALIQSVAGRPTGPTGYHQPRRMVEYISTRGVDVKKRTVPTHSWSLPWGITFGNYMCSCLFSFFVRMWELCRYGSLVN